MGDLSLQAGLTAEARAWFEQAIRIDPTRQHAQAALAGPTSSAPTPKPPRLVRSADRKVAGAPAPEGSATARFRLEDVADRAGLGFRYESGADETHFIADTMGGGVGVFDYDDDGHLDIYFVNGCPLPVDPRSPASPNKLFRNRGDGTFEDVTRRAGVGGRGYGMGCTVGDYDNDGHDDLFVTGLSSTILYRNRGDGTFEDVTNRAGVGSSRWTTASGFGDLDGDGDLDLVVITYVDADPRSDQTCLDATGRRIHCLPSRYKSQADLLFRNDGDGKFTEVSREAGFDGPDRPGLGLAIADFDDDGKLDLFVANDATADCLFLNRGGLRFEEAGLLAGVAYTGSGQATASMGVVANDLDGDGLIDLLHTNFLHEACTLLRNLGGNFVDATEPVGLRSPTLGMTGFGAVSADFDNDGRPDLFLANGHVDDQPWLGTPMAQRPQLFAGGAGGRFAEAPASASPYLARPVVGRGAAAGDFDNDGRVDLVVVHRDAPAALLRNTSDAGHWLGLRLRGRASGRTPVGARVTCRSGGRVATRWLTGGTGYLVQNDPRLWIGLGDSRRIDRLEVRWPSGLQQSWADLDGDRIIEIVEGRDAFEARPPAPPIR